MAEILFYHLTEKPLEAALPELLSRTLARGWRATVRCGSPERAADLSRRLWTFADDSFLPHGDASDGRAERQPIYLTAGGETPNAPDALFLVDGAAVDPSEAGGFTRVCVLFDGRDAAQLGAARRAWKATVDAEVSAIYWAQEAGGRWTKKAERAPDAGAENTDGSGAT